MSFKRGHRLIARSPSDHGARENIYRPLRLRLRSLIVCIFCLSIMSASKLRAQQDAAVLFDSTCGVCHGSDGRGGERGPNIATKREMVNLSDVQLNVILHKGVLASGMPAFGNLGDEKITQLIGHLRQLQGMAGPRQAEFTGDVGDGEKTFFAEGSCSSCHMIHGRGGFLGQDLSEFARGRSPQAIRAAILHPEDSPEGADHLTDIQTTEGASYRGLIRSQDNFTVILLTEDGGFKSIARTQIQKLIIHSQPLMPQNYSTRLAEKQLTNLISYLLKTAGSGRLVSKSSDEQ
jgi:cytochrome c oxidase cbb3-type subunit III